MKYLLSLGALLLVTTVIYAQTRQVENCVIENGTLKNVTTDYDPATGNYSIKVNGVAKPFDEIHPPTGKDYAGSATWYINNEPVVLNGQRYVKYGLPRILYTNEVQKTSEYKQVGVYVEAGSKGIAEVIYIPVRRGCEFQPYQQEVPKVTQTTKTGQQKIYYDENWKATSASNAAYYRIVTLDAAGKPVGLVKDFYITGEKQWEGNISYMDPANNGNDITEGLNTWFYKNGKKSAQVTTIHGKEQGVYKFWSESGDLQEEVEYKNGVRHGFRKIYASDGTLTKTEHYTDDKLDEK
jgi:antitoxin component YwqK of YwqJK toxin-antitoxin module